MLDKKSATDRIGYLKAVATAGLQEAQAKIQKTVAKAQMEDGNTVFTSFHLEHLVTGSAETMVYGRILGMIEHHADRDVRIQVELVTRMVEDQASRQWKPNSTSNQSVELELTETFLWREVWNRHFNTSQWVSIDDLQDELDKADKVEDGFCVICEGKSDFKLSDEGFCGPCFDAQEEEDRLQEVN